MDASPKKPLSPLEHKVMEVVWEQSPCTAEQVRQALDGDKPLKDSTVRTVLRRLEEKGYVRHRIEGRTYVYHHRVPAQQAALRAVSGIVERFCGGSVERLLTGMVDSEMISPDELEHLARRIAEETDGKWR